MCFLQGSCVETERLCWRDLLCLFFRPGGCCPYSPQWTRSKLNLSRCCICKESYNVDCVKFTNSVSAGKGSGRDGPFLHSPTKKNCKNSEIQMKRLRKQASKYLRTIVKVRSGHNDCFVRAWWYFQKKKKNNYNRLQQNVFFFGSGF